MGQRAAVLACLQEQLRAASLPAPRPSLWPVTRRATARPPAPERDAHARRLLLELVLAVHVVLKGWKRVGVREGAGGRQDEQRQRSAAVAGKAAPEPSAAARPAPSAQRLPLTLHGLKGREAAVGHADAAVAQRGCIGRPGVLRAGEAG